VVQVSDTTGAAQPTNAGAKKQSLKKISFLKSAHI
jgi:hypothetical protein